MNKYAITRSPILFRSLSLFIALLIFTTLPCGRVDASSDIGLSVSMPNGYANIRVNDLLLASKSGTIRWQRWWDGQQWKFNPHWESLSQTWSNVTCDKAMLSPSGGGWQLVWVDDAVSSINASMSGPQQPSAVIPGALPKSLSTTIKMDDLSTQPFNQIMSTATVDYPAPKIVDAQSCLAQNLSGGNMEGIRRENELYIGKNGHYVFNNSAVLNMRPVQGLAQSPPDSLAAQLATGTLTIAPVAIPKGFRWSHKEGDWIDYNLRGQVVAYGDHNNNTIWLARDSNGLLHGVVDGDGRVLMTLHYTGELLTAVTDFPVVGNLLDLPVRTLSYKYDADNRLTHVTDVRGNLTRYDYNAQNHITFITDPENRSEQLAYINNSVSQHAAADGGVTDYTFGFDDVNQQFNSKVTGPVTASGRRVDDITTNDTGKLVRRITNGRTDDDVLYDTAARTESHTNARGFKTLITRNEFEQITRIDYPDGSHEQRSYSALNSRLLEAVDEAGIRTQYDLDAKGNVLKKTQAVGTADQRITEYLVNSLGQATQLTRKGRIEANGTITADATWRIEYDNQGQISTLIDPEGGVRHYVFDRAGNLAKFTDPLNHSRRYEVDADGNLIKVTDAQGRIDSFTYDKVGNLLNATDARGKITQAAYDAMNRLLQVTNPVGGIAKLQYDNNGLPTSVTDEDGRSIHIEFDNFQRLTQLSDGLGNQTRFGYNIPDGTPTGALGSLSTPTEIKFPTFTQNNRLDPRERITSEALLNPNHAGTYTITSSKSFDARGDINSDTDANGKQRNYKVNAFGQTTEFNDRLGNLTKALYDVRGNLIQLTDANGNAHTFEYDRNDRVVKTILPLGQATHYQYDATGNLIQRIDPNDHLSTYTYDAAAWLTDIKYYKTSTDTQPVRTTILTWDDVHNLTAWSDTDATRPSGQQTADSTASYDDSNRKIQETITYPTPQGLSYSLSYSYQYSKAGDKTQLTWADGTLIDYSYSAHGELASITIPGEGIISVDQFKWMAPSSVTLPGGTVQSSTYDGLLNLEALKVKNPSQQPVLALSNSYNKRLELGTRSRSDTQAGLNSTIATDFTYDDESRLSQAITDTGSLFGSSTESFTLDAVGNRTAHSKVLGNWSYDANNRLNEQGLLLNAASFNYDAAGNLITKTQGSSVTHYAYDSQHRLIQITDTNGQLIARYGYDPMDRRLWKEQYRNKDGSALAQATRSYYLYSEEGLIAVSQQDIIPPLTLEEGGGSTANTPPTIQTQFGHRPNSQFGTGVLFIKTKNSNHTDTIAYYHHDHLNTPIQATDKTGNVVWSAQYNAFGRASITTPAATLNKPTISSELRLPGQSEDPESGLHYNWHRYYDPELGRYITSDPIGLVGGINTYAYVGGDPVNWSDPTGNCPLCVAAVALAFEAWNIYDSVNDAVDTASVVGDPCTSGSDKLAAIGLFGLGVLDPSPGNLGKKVLQGAKYGPLNPGPLATDIANTFRSGTYTGRTLSSDQTLYRVMSRNGNPTGSYWTSTKPQGPLQSVIDSALDQNWGNNATEVVTAMVPSGTTIYEGAAAAQRGLVGGGNQIYIPRVNSSWIVH